MAAKTRYMSIGDMESICRIAGISPDRIRRRAGLGSSMEELRRTGVTASEYFALCTALEEESDRADLPVFLGQTSARVPRQSEMLAYTCSPDVETGIRRLALFKPLLAPVSLGVERRPTGLHLTCAGSDPDLAIPTSYVALHGVFIVELVRTTTAAHVVPRAVHMPDPGAARPALEAFFGCAIEPAAASEIILSHEDAQRPLISENEAVWRAFEPDLQKRLAARNKATTMTERVRTTLIELLPSGEVSADAVADRQRVSKRSLQRKLSEEGVSYQAVLDGIRSELATRYLRRGDLSVGEISYLLGFRDPNSFYRAFQKWTRTTPARARLDLMEAPG